MTNDQLNNAMVAAGLGFGAAAILAPRALGRAYGINGTGDTDEVMRLYGTRTAALGILAAVADSDRSRATITKTVAGMSALDTVNAVRAGIRGTTSRRTAAQTALTTAGVTALCLLALRG